jgi:hypothetical protein
VAGKVVGAGEVPGETPVTGALQRGQVVALLGRSWPQRVQKRETMPPAIATGD